MPLSPDVSDKFYSLQVTSDQSYDFELATRKQGASDRCHRLCKKFPTRYTQGDIMGMQ